MYKIWRAQGMTKYTHKYILINTHNKKCVQNICKTKYTYNKTWLYKIKHTYNKAIYRIKQLILMNGHILAQLEDFV